MHESSHLLSITRCMEGKLIGYGDKLLVIKMLKIDGANR